MLLLPLLPQNGETDYTLFAICLALIAVVVLIVELAALWRIFRKAGEPGWASLVPLYNLIVLLRITGVSVWQIIYLFIPPLQVVLLVTLAFALSHSFQKNLLYAFAMIFFFPILVPVLAFGNACYLGPMGPSYR